MEIWIDPENVGVGIMVNLPGLFRRTATAGVIKLKTAFSKILLGSNEHQLYEDSSGNLVLKADATGKAVVLDGKSKVQINADGSTGLTILTSDVRSSFDFLLRSGKELRLYKSDNSAYGLIVDDGGNIKFKDEAGTEIFRISTGFGYFPTKMITSNYEPVTDGDKDVGTTSKRYKRGFINRLSVGSYTTAERDAMSDIANGDIIYNSDTGQFEGYQSGSWAGL